MNEKVAVLYIYTPIGVCPSMIKQINSNFFETKCLIWDSSGTIQHLKLFLISPKKCMKMEKLESLIRWHTILLGSSKFGCFKYFKGKICAVYTVRGTIKLTIPSLLNKKTGPAPSFLAL